MRTDEELKKLLCGVSPHLHSRIIKSVRQNDDNLELAVDKKASREFIAKMINELSIEKEDEKNTSTPSLEVTLESTEEDGYHLRIKALNSDKDLNFIISELEKRQKDWEVIWDIKNATERFDFSLIELKTLGGKSNVKFDNLFIKAFDPGSVEIVEYFAYVVLRKFLGTKSPEVNIIRGEQYFWMESKDLSHSYEKNGSTKENKFSMLSKVFPDAGKRLLLEGSRSDIPDWIIEMTPQVIVTEYFFSA